MRVWQSWRVIAAALVAASFCAVVLLFIGVGEEPEADAARAIAVTAVPGATNRVAAVVLDVRLYDTLFELFAFAMAVLGVRLFLRPSRPVTAEAITESHILRRAALVLLPPVLLLGAYLALFGHVSPGGGFSGGAVAATGLLLVAVALGADALARRFRDRQAEMLEGVALAVILGLVLLPLVWGGAVALNFLPAGTPGRIASAGTIPLYSVLIAVKVFAGAWAVIHYFIRHRGEI
jgi:multicomponent Na+:H+ antiporter subunit B